MRLRFGFSTTLDPFTAARPIDGTESFLSVFGINGSDGALKEEVSFTLISTGVGLGVPNL